MRRGVRRLTEVFALGCVAVGIVGLSSPAIHATQQPPSPQTTVATPVVLRLEAANRPSFVAPVELPAGPRAQAAPVSVAYSGFSPSARQAFERAVEIWASQLDLTIPIEIAASWEELDPGILGYAGPYQLIANFPRAPQRDMYYPLPLANQFAQRDLLAGQPDIVAVFSSRYTNWYFGTDGHTPLGQIDFVTTVLHELGHGFGFVGSMTVDAGGVGSYQPFIYDTFGVTGQGVMLLSLTNNSMELGQELQSEALAFAGPQAMTAAGGVRPRLYAPTNWMPGSSFSHLDEATYPPGHPDSLMTPQIGWAEAIHDPGSITRGIFRDLGWTILAPDHQLYLPLIARRTAAAW